MTHPARRKGLSLAVIVLSTGSLALQATAMAAAPPTDLTPGQQQALDAGFQVAPKQSAAKSAGGAVQPNPYLADIVDATKADYAGWRARMATAGRARSSSQSYRAARKDALAATPQAAATPAVVHDEQEPAGTGGSNDTLATAERIPLFGTASNRSNVLRILGEQAAFPAPAATALPPVPEDNGSIPLAGASGIVNSASRTTTGVLGDGPHGSTGTGTNDFDFYSVDVAAGLAVTAETTGTTDTILALYDATGELVATDDDGGVGFASLLDYQPEAAGTYYLMVAGYSPAGPLPDDPFDSASGNGGADEGDYGLSIATARTDADNYAVRLRPGDVIGSVSGGAADSLTVYRPDGTQMVGASGVDASSLYAPESPLPGGGNTTLAYVAEQAGWYVVNVDGDPGDYDVRLEGYRPGAETDAVRKQTVYLDFEGGRVNTGIWGGSGVSELSPFSAFLGKWGLPRNREAAMITKITREVRENIATEVAATGLNPDLKVTVVNSRNHPEVAGRKNVSRIIVGGTIAQSGISTIGIAQYIDPGNYGHEDSALVLLDVLSDPTGPASLNTYLTAASDREAFVSQAVGNVTAHEIGHLIGSYHTDNTSATVNLMDAGGANFQNLFGVGPDGVGGTADDANVAFEEDTYSPVEGFTGLEDTQNVTAWAYPAT